MIHRHILQQTKTCECSTHPTRRQAVERPFFRAGAHRDVKCKWAGFQAAYRCTGPVLAAAW